MESPNVLILDEPTNDLDIPTLTILEDYLDSFSGIIITVSHDRYFLDNVVERIFAFEGNGKLRQYEGAYTDYLEACQRMGLTDETTFSGARQVKTANSPEEKKNNAKEWKQNQPAKLKFSFKEQREYDMIDDEIATLEEKIEKLDVAIMENATNSAKLSELMEEKSEAEAQLEEKMDRWVYLNDLAEKIEAQKK